MALDVFTDGCYFIFDLMNACNLAFLPVTNEEALVESTKSIGIEYP